ncbi:Ig-like domain-containing protein [Salisediminibacterium beveridgei]|uniref:S-Layer Domain-Containing Protein n=1 Tax=Salisediminibacterium beveridgei TaxID=632773 RepID=A0A1D7QRX3_9BACI|nr:Ig-like domain-containing protein [Salisediminibacterium beveridgei]AOM81738.1 S-Layer Domain-Containing Protein [Salisediminibacterium beveridgei]
MKNQSQKRKARRFRKGLKQKSTILLFCLALTFSPYSIVAEGKNGDESDEKVTEEVTEEAENQEEAANSEEVEEESSREEEQEEIDETAEEDEGVTEEEGEGTEEESDDETEGDQEETTHPEDDQKEENEDSIEKTEHKEGSSEDGTNEEDESSNTSTTKEDGKKNDEKSSGDEGASSSSASEPEVNDEGGSTVINPNDLVVSYGTAREDLSLPERVTVDLTNDQYRSVEVEWDDGEPDYDGFTPGTYQFTGEVQFYTMKATMNVEVAEPVITGVDEQDPVYVSSGIEFADLPLPDVVDVELEDGSREEVKVTWEEGTNGESFYPEVPGVYNIIGQLELPDGMENPDQVSASISVVVEYVDIVDVEEFQIPTAVNYGTERQDLPLPGEVEVTLGNGEEVPLTVTWEESEGQPEYDGERRGSILFTGTFDVPVNPESDQGMMNQSNAYAGEYVFNPRELAAEFTIIVNPPTILSVIEPDPVDIPYGTEKEDTHLPDEVEVILWDENHMFLDVIWWASDSETDFDPFTPGEYEVTGRFLQEEIGAASVQSMDRGAFPDYEGLILNPSGIDPVVTLIVQAPEVTDVVDPDPLRVGYGTELGDVPLPEELDVTLNDGTSIDVPVTWEEGDPAYDGETPGDYAFTGTLEVNTPERNGNEVVLAEDETLLDLVTNPDGMTADLTVTVDEPMPVAVEQFDPMEVPFGTLESELDLPEEGTVSFEDDSEEVFAIEWTESDPEYDGERGGTYLFRGILQDGIGDEFSEVSIEVIVLEEEVDEDPGATEPDEPKPDEPEEKEENEEKDESKEKVEEKEEDKDETLPQTNQNMNMSLYLAGALFILLAVGLAVRNRKTGTVNE